MGRRQANRSFAKPGSWVAGFGRLRGGRAARAVSPTVRAAAAAVEALEGRALFSGSLVSDVNVGPASSAPGDFATLNGSVYFSANDGTHGRELYRHDQAAGTTTRLTDLQPANASTAVMSVYAFGNQIFFAGNNTGGLELWRYDPAVGTAAQVMDINPGVGNSTPANFFAFNGKLYFAADDGTYGTELWAYDPGTGTAGMVANINPSGASTANGSVPTNFVAFGGKLYFSAYSGSYDVGGGTMVLGDQEVWELDPAAIPGLQLREYDLASGDNGSLPMSERAVVGGRLYFGATDDGGDKEIWSLDGTGSAPVKVTNVNAAGSSGISGMVTVGGKLYFRASDGSVATGAELYSYDPGTGTAAVAAEVRPGTASSSVALLTAIGGKVYFRANDGTTGNEPWVYDPATGTATQILDVAAGVTGSVPTKFFGAGDKVYFTAGTGNSHYVLYEYDPATATAAVAAEVDPAANSFMNGYGVVGGTIYFAAADTAHGEELFSHVAFVANTVPVIGGAIAGQPATDDAAVAPFAALTVADPDTQAMTATVTIVDGANRGDFTAASSTDLGWARAVNGDDVVYTRSFASAADIGSVVQAAVRALSFSPRQNAIASGTTETTTFTVGVDDGAATAANGSTVSVVTTSVNDAPTLSGGPATASTAEDAASAGVSVGTLLTSLTYADADAVAVAARGVAVTTAGGLGAWQYSVDGGTQWTAFGTVGNGAALLLAEAALVRYVPNTIDGETATIAFHGWDTTAGTASAAGARQLADINALGTGGSSAFSVGSATFSMTVTAVNDAPVVTVPATRTIAEDAAATLAGSAAVSVADIDAGAGLVRVTLAATDGVVRVGSGSGLSALTNNETASVELTGTVAAVNAALDGLTFTPTTDFHGTAVLTVTANDQGNTGVGPLTDTETVNITVTPLADAATVTPATTAEDTLSSGGLVVGRGAADGAEVTHFKVTNINHGRVYLADGTTEVAAGAFVTYAQGQAGLRFAPAADYNGSAAGFDVQASTSAADAGLGGAVARAAVTVTAVNDDPVANADAATVAEDAVATPIDVLANDNAGPEVGETLAVTAVSAGSHGGTIAINANNTGLTYAPAADFNGTETFTYTLGDGNGGTAIATVTVTVTAANDAPANAVPAAYQTTPEHVAIVFSAAGGNAITVADVDAAPQPLTVTLTASHGTLAVGGTAGLDSVANDGSAAVTVVGPAAAVNAALDGLTFTPAAGFSGPATITVVTSDGGATGTGGVLGDTDVLTVDVAEAGTLRLSSATYTAGEGDGTVTVTVERVGGTAGTVSVSYATANGTAAATEDYTATSGTITFLDGETTKTFDVPVLTDGLNEDAETVQIALSSSGVAELGTAAATLTIADDDALPALSVNDASAAEGADGATTSVTFQVQLSAASGRTVTVNWATADGTATTAGGDYAAASGALTFAPGETTKSVTVTAAGDDLFEPAETFAVTLSGATNATLADAVGTGTLTNDDLSAPAASVADASHTETDGPGGTMTFTVQLSRASGVATTVNYATAAGTATAGTDYTDVAGTLTFAPGQTSRTITVPVVGDARDEANETFALILTGPTGGATLGDAQAVGTIVDNDPTPAVSIADATVTEGDAGTIDLTFAVTLSAASGRTVTIDFATAAGTAADGVDYDAAAGTVTFAPGETSKSVTVRVRGDAADEVNETLTVGLTNPALATINDGTAAGTIIDNDNPPAVSVGDVNVAEPRTGQAAAVFTVTLSAASGKPVTVDYATAPGSANAGADYVSAEGTLTFAPGETSKTVDVTVLGDAAAEGTETFVLELVDVGNAVIANDQGTAFVRNANGAPTAADDAAELVPGESVGVAVLANDADPDGDPLSLAVATAPAHGSAVVDTNGTANPADDTIRYSATPGYVGDDSFTYRVTDAAGATATATVRVTLRGVGLAADPADTTRQALVIAAGDGGETIVLDRMRRGQVRVTTNGDATGVFAPTTRIIIRGGDGDDSVVAGKMDAAVQFFGGDGNDSLTGGRRGDVLIGGPGDDTIRGGPGRDILIGGGGADTIYGLDRGDVLIPGTTDYDADTEANRAATADLLAAWSGPGSYAAVVAKLTGGTGASGARLSATTVRDDGAVDTLVGGAGVDLLFARSAGGTADKLLGRRGAERAIEI